MFRSTFIGISSRELNFFTLEATIKSLGEADMSEKKIRQQDENRAHESNVKFSRICMSNTMKHIKPQYVWREEWSCDLCVEIVGGEECQEATSSFVWTPPSSMWSLPFLPSPELGPWVQGPSTRRERGAPGSGRVWHSRSFWVFSKFNPKVGIWAWRFWVLGLKGVPRIQGGMKGGWRGRGVGGERGGGGGVYDHVPVPRRRKEH